MQKIRQGVFETNSSSTHSICIATDVKFELPKEILFRQGEFGWEENELNSISEKASYLYTGMISNNMNNEFNEIVKFLEAQGIVVTVDAIFSGYVDHSYKLADFLNAVVVDKKLLLNYLFSGLSFVLTGNDNDESDIDINVDYLHQEFYKGN